MAFIDYGALLRVDGVFLNKDKDLFMDASDTGYVCGAAIDEDGNEHIIDGNYYVYAGDEKLMLCFYKGTIVIVSGNKVIEVISPTQFAAETYTAIPGLEELKVSHLDKQKYPDEATEMDFYDYLDYSLAVTDAKPTWKNYVNYCRMIKNFRRWNRRNKSFTYRFLAEWDYGGHHYEVIYGYGIDPDTVTWCEISSGDSYGFTDTERYIIDRWFTEWLS